MIFLLEFKYINIVSNVAKLRSFQYRLLNLAIITNVDLYCWNVRQSEQCSFCSQARETVAHLFFECYTIQELWRSISDLIMDLFKVSPNVTMKSIMFNSILDDRSHVANLICLLVKQYIYRQRCLDKPIRFSECKNIIFNTRNTEKYIAVKNGTVKKHLIKWSLSQNESDNRPSNEIEEFIQEHMHML